MAKIIKRICILICFAIIGFVAILFFTNKPGIPKVKAAIDQTITDQNNDGIINLADARILAPPATTSCLVCVDVNGDKKIDQKDVNLVQARVDQKLPYQSRFDVNNDGVINVDDVNIIKSYVGQTVTGPAFGLDNPSELTFGFLANDIMIKFKSGTSQQQKDALYKKYGLNSKRDLAKINAAELRANQNNVETLQKQIGNEPEVMRTEKSFILELMTNDPNWPDQWGPVKINIPAAWYIGITGKSSIKVGLVDSGADYTHPDMGNLSQTKRYDATNLNPSGSFGSQDLSDPVGHGTHMAGIIGAVANNGKAVAGINWNVEIIPVKACRPDSRFLAVCLSPDLYAALAWLSDQSVDVVNLSLGSNVDSQSVNDYLDWFKTLGIPVIAAAGGNGGVGGCLWPASHPGVTCVSATDRNDNFASCSDGIVDSNISAPGQDIVSTVPTNSIVDTNHDGIENFGCGTSMATAYITGVVALCKSITAQNPKDFLKCNHFNNFDYTTNRRIDAWTYLWYRSCKIFDNTGPTGSPDHVVDLRDIQTIAFNVGSSFYNRKLDVWPAGGDGVVDGRDLYTAVFGHMNDVCQ